jgi:hypothetical protein
LFSSTTRRAEKNKNKRGEGITALQKKNSSTRRAARCPIPRSLPNQGGDAEKPKKILKIRGERVDISDWAG